MIRGPAPKSTIGDIKSARGDRRITLTVNGDDNVTRIEVELDEFAWNVDRTGVRSLVVTIMDVTSPIPTSLNRVNGVPYKNYQFTTSSTTTGSFRRLTKNDLGEEAQPSIKIGNIDSGTTDAITAGAVSVTPEKIYRGDEVDFKISFKAAGPIYDIDSNNDGDAWKLMLR